MNIPSDVLAPRQDDGRLQRLARAVSAILNIADSLNDLAGSLKRLWDLLCYVWRIVRGFKLRSVVMRVSANSHIGKAIAHHARHTLFPEFRPLQNVADDSSELTLRDAWVKVSDKPEVEMCIPSSRQEEIALRAGSHAALHEYKRAASLSYTQHQAAHDGPIYLHEDQGSMRLSDFKGSKFETLHSKEARQIRDLVRTFQSSEDRYASLDRKWCLNLMLHGKPGTGKSSVASAIAHETGRTLVIVNLSQMVTIKQLITNVRFVIEDYRKPASAFVFLFEEFDTWAPARQNRALHEQLQPEQHQPPQPKRQQQRMTLRKEQEARDNQLGLLLELLDSALTPHGLITVFTSNYVTVFDAALTRENRMNCVEFGDLDADSVDAYLRMYFGADSGSFTESERAGFEAGPLAGKVTLARLSQWLGSFKRDDVIRELLGEGKSEGNSEDRSISCRVASRATSSTFSSPDGSELPSEIDDELMRSDGSN
jgi:ATPase family associated with various cellular activities (AAA)